MSKGPLITRAELRKRRDENEQLNEAREKESYKEQRAAEKEYEKKEKEISDFYRKERKKSKEITKTRAGEQGRIRERSTVLTKAIIVVAILLAIVVFIVLNL